MNGNGAQDPAPGVSARRGEPHLSNVAVPRRLAEIPATDNSHGDWDALFSAVQAKLRLSVSVGLASVSSALEPKATQWLQGTVLECVEALELLHVALTQERASRDRFEKDARGRLAQAHEDLQGTRARERLARHRALHDDLTSLPNRAAFRHRLDACVANNQFSLSRFAVLYLDLDDFKLVNDRHGHSVGDELLQIVAARMSRAVRNGDMVSRLGGDEFACLIDDVGSNSEQLAQLAAKIGETIAAPVTIGAVHFSVTPSVGIALFPDDGSSGEALLRSADSAMYEAKRRGYRFKFYSECMSLIEKT